jgi:lysophospholipase L1-like esterase
MPSASKARVVFIALLGTVSMHVGCGGDAGSGGQGDGGAVGSGGVTAAGGMSGSAGASGRGGNSSSAGTTGTAGTIGTAGTTGTSGTTGVGATTGGGGRSGSGGTTGAGGASGTGGAAGTGGTAGARDGGGGDAGLDAGNDAAGGGDAAGGPPGVRLVGRFDTTDATRPSFSWSGSAMLAHFQGTSATLRIDGSPNQFTVVVDGNVASQVLKVVNGTSQYTIATGLAAGTHDVVVWKRTEGNQGPNRFLGIDITGGQLLAPRAPPARRIEIYGDSITAGYGMDGAGPNCPYTPDTENHYLTYAALAARTLDADLHAIAWSGIGMYRNYGVSGASADAMPAVYARILASQAASVWDFATWQPHVVVINLGTNDASTNGDPGTPYETAYLGFVRTLRQKYPDAHFLLTIGPMLDGANLTAIKGHLQKVISTRSGEGDTKMSFLEFPVQQQADGYGCDYHPSPATNAKMATLLTGELRARLGW